MKNQHPILGSTAKPLAWRRVRSRRSAWLIAAALSPLVLSACGQKGPLYLPPAATAPAAALVAPSTSQVPAP